MTEHRSPDNAAGLGSHGNAVGLVGWLPEGGTVRLLAAGNFVLPVSVASHPDNAEVWADDIEWMRSHTV